MMMEFISGGLARGAMAMRRTPWKPMWMSGGRDSTSCLAGVNTQHPWVLRGRSLILNLPIAVRILRWREILPDVMFTFKRRPPLPPIV
jgi:hypothetical protein